MHVPNLSEYLLIRFLRGALVFHHLLRGPRVIVVSIDCDYLVSIFSVMDLLRVIEVGDVCRLFVG